MRVVSLRATCGVGVLGAVLSIPASAAAEVRSFVCNVPASQLQVVRTDSRPYGSDVYDNIYAQVPGCGGTVNPGDRVIVRFNLELPVVVSPLGPNTWFGFGGGLWSPPVAGFGPLLYTSQSITVDGSNVRTAPVAGGAAYTTGGPDNAWPISGADLGAGGPDLIIDPAKPAVITAFTITMDLPVTVIFGGVQRTLAPGNLSLGNFAVTAYRNEYDPQVVVGPMVVVGTPLGQVQKLSADTTMVLQAESVSATTVAALTTKLDAAMEQIASGQPTAAAGQLRAFVNQVNSLVNAGTISEDAAEKLTEPALELIKRVRPR